MEIRLAALLLVGCVLAGCAGRKSDSVAETMASDTAGHQEMADTTEMGVDDEDQLIASEPMSTAVDELFDDFIFNFASNRRLQLQRTVFPLPVHEGEEEKTVGRKAWKMEHFFMRQDYYTLIFDSPEQMELASDTSLSRATVEKIFLENKLVRQYLFERQNGLWMLTSIHVQSLPRNPNAQFLSFYEQFASDSLFQHESLSERIVFVGPDPDDDFAQVEGVITPDFWDAFRPELPTDTLFNIVYGPQNPAVPEKVFVLRGIANGLEMELTFKLQNGKWKLTKMIM